MKASINQNDFLEGLKSVSRVVSGQNTLPVLGNILIKAEGKRLYLSATNLEISISTHCEADVKNEGAITIPAKILTAYVSLLKKEDDVELQLTDGLTLSLKSASSKTKIKGISAEEFPKITLVEGGTDIELAGKDFRSLVQEVAFAAHENAARPILSGTYWQIQEKELRVASTDSYRLSEKFLTLKNPVREKIASVVPVRALLEADRMLNTEEGLDVKMLFSENQVMFIMGNTHLVSRLIEGQYPDYQQIIPKNTETTVTVSKEELILAVRRVSIFARENNQHMKLVFLNDNTMTVSTDSTQVGEEITTLPIEIQGATNTIALNADYVLDILGALKGEKIRIEMQQKMNPAVFKSEKGEDFTHLVMPLKN